MTDDIKLYSGAAGHAAPEPIPGSGPPLAEAEQQGVARQRDMPALDMDAALSRARDLARHIRATPQPALPPPQAGTVLIRLLRRLRMSANALALQLRVPHSRISDILRPRRPRAITADTALRLEEYFRVPAEAWLILQMERDLAEARAVRAGTNLEPLEVQG